MENKKGLSILKIVIIILLSVLILCSLAINILFSKNKTPKIFGNYVYVVADEAMSNEVVKGSALIAKADPTLPINVGDVILCKLNGNDQIMLRSVYKITVDEATGASNYYPATDIEQGVELSISRDDIVALCSGYPASTELGKYITFTTNFKGILLQLILPCVILVIFLICKIARSNDEEDDANFDFYNYENEGNENTENKIPQKPLFNPEKDPIGNDELERKKMSIAENFSKKTVNPDSPYQKEKERTMQFKAQRSAESSFAARNVGGQSSTAPTADALREEMLRRTAEAERTTATLNSNKGSMADDNTLIISAADLPRTEPLKTRSAPQVSAFSPKPSKTPNIDDIIQKTDPAKKSSSISAMSVDDLLKVIESEKKKL